MEYIIKFDREIFLMINSLHAEWLNSPMLFFSGQIIWAPFILFILYYAYFQMNKKYFYLFLLFLAMTIISSDVSSSYLMKNIFQRMRPCRLDELKPFIYQFGQKCGGKYGFVSSHAANSFAAITFSTLCLKFRPKFFRLFWILPCLVAYSRIYTGVHYPGDVIMGSIVGIIFGMLMALLYKNSTLRGEPT
jgi:undecaprenyl-diphosphatase